MKHWFAALSLAVFVGYLGISNGHLALFEENRPVQVFPYAVENYSYADQEALKKGIPYHTSLEKQRILEDYLS
jgi:hypothetical protein